MKKMLFVLVLLMPFGAFADCAGISNSDARNYCYATTRNDSFYCAAINNQDKANYCKAVVRNDKFYCAAISDYDTKQDCYAQF
jgi:hypothetical protein